MASPLPHHPNLPAAYFAIAEQQPDLVVYRQPTVDAADPLNGPRLWHDTTYGQSVIRVKKLARHLKRVGVRPGSKVAIVSSSRPEWMEADLAILSLGGIVVSVYQSLPAHEVAYILFDSEAEFAIVENQEQVDKLLEIQQSATAIPATEERKELTAEVRLQHIVSIEQSDDHELVSNLAAILAEGEEAPRPDEFQSLTRESLASLVYTSGTTGPPKGVMQTHGNHLANVEQVMQLEMMRDNTDFMLFLPLAHSFAKLIGYIGFLTTASLKFPGVFDRRSSKMEPQSISRDISESAALVVPVVPRLLEKMKAGVESNAESGGIKGLFLSVTLWSAREMYRAKEQGTAPGMKAQMAFAGTAGVRQKIKEKLFGPRLLFALSGGAKLPVEVARFFDSLEIEVLEGYGLTETCVATNVNLLGKKKIGTVGPALPGVEQRIAADGEILFRGPNVAIGYYNRPSATKKSWDADGWYATGDLGSIDDAGYLTIEGRKKDIIVTSGGKNIAPARIEEGIKESKYVSQAVVVGDGRKYCVALVTLNHEQVREWARSQGIATLD
ncbi:MAG: AMP-binding protein, partial [Bdellovibrionales bacterium]|nr:AMP-binding protein [Bdellovibrionales bacterium]